MDSDDAGKAAAIDVVLILDGLAEALDYAKHSGDWASRHAEYVRAARRRVAVVAGVSEADLKYGGTEWFAALMLAFSEGVDYDRLERARTSVPPRD